MEHSGLSAVARAVPVTARVRLRLVVQADGTVGSVGVAVSSRRADLDAAAIDAARAWRFLPALRDRAPIESRVLIWVVFVMEP